MIILVVLGTWLLQMSWQKWTNLTVDYGRELYTPWQISCGQVLYKDIASLFGPFPPYWNALLFKVFGASILTLALFNVVLVIGIAVLIYRFFVDTTDKLAAFFASAAFLIIFAFQQNNGNGGNYAYICPYSYSATYAAFFSLWAIDMFAAYGRSGKDTLLAAIGVLIGLTVLCRFEIFVFIAIALCLGFIFKGIIGQWLLSRFLKTGTLILAGFCIPVGAAYLYFSTQVPLPQVWPDIFGFNDKWFEILRTSYYQFTTGLDHPWHNFMIMLATAACYGVVFATFKCLCAGVDRLEKSRQRWEGIILIALGLAGVAVAGIWATSFHYDSIFKGLPVVVFFMVGYLLWGWRRQDERQVSRALSLWVMALWGLLMLTKVFLNVQIDTEGFVYAMPGVVLLFVLFLFFVPKYFERKYKRGYFIKILAGTLAALIFMTGLMITVFFFQSRNSMIRSGPDTIICDGLSNGPEIAEIAAFLKDADKIMDKHANFVVFPQGVMLNFLTKRKNPLPYIVFQPSELIKFSGQEMLRSFKERKPDYVILSNDDPDFTGGDFSVISTWVLANYHPVWPAHPKVDNVMTVLKRSQ